MITAACSMEWIKLRSLRSTWWMLAIFVASMIGLGILGTTIGTPGKMTEAARESFDPTNQGFIGMVVAQIVIGVFGVLAFTGEFSSGMIRATLGAVNKRDRAFGGKVFVVGLSALACAEVIAFATFFAGEAALRQSLPHASITQPAVIRAVLLSGVYLFLIALIGLGLGALFRHAAAGIGVLVGAVFALPLVAAALPNHASIQKFLPEVIAANSMTEVKPVPVALGPWTGLLMMCLYTAVVLAAGFWAFTRRDA